MDSISWYSVWESVASGPVWQPLATLLTAGISGAFGAKALETWARREKEKSDDAARLRDEIWSEMRDLRRKVESVEKELRGQHKENLELIRDISVLREEASRLRMQIDWKSAEYEELKTENEELKAQLDIAEAKIKELEQLLFEREIQ